MGITSGDMIPRPPQCCGVCPAIVGGRYDCACEGNPRCTGRTYDAVITREGGYNVITVEGIGATQALVGDSWGIPNATHDMILAVLGDPSAEIAVSYTWSKA